MATKKSKGIGGRKPGMTKDITDARKIIRTQGELEGEISKDALKAYSVIRGVMEDTNAPGASRRAAAKDVLDMFKVLLENSEKKLEDFYGEFEDSNSESEEDSGNVQFLFSEK